MARKLPWSASASTVSTTPRQAKRRKIDLSDSTQATINRFVKAEASADVHDDQNGNLAARPGRTSQRTKPHTRHGRTPSTSPPPGPPPIELMQEGLDADDIYMMVEDEFHAIAQSYTAHLHHAEYKRLMREAKERNNQKRSTVPEIPRGASFETKLRLKKAGLSERQSTGLKEMITPGLLIDSDEEENDKTLGEEEKTVAEPWAGTSLAGLMSWDASQRTSLKGLNKLKSETRAAQGFGPSTTAVKTQISTAKTTNTIGHAASINSKPQQRESSKPTASTIVVKGDPALSPATKPNHQKQTAKKPRSFIDDLDDWDDDRFDMLQAAAQPALKQEESESAYKKEDKSRIKREDRSPAIRKRKETKKGDQRERYDEIPLFLV